MSDNRLECHGLPCPQPVIRCKEFIDDNAPKSLSVVVDNEAAKENVTRFLDSQGYEVSVTEGNDDFIVSGLRASDGSDECAIMGHDEISSLASQKTLIFIASDRIGSGDDELGQKLMYNFLLTLKEMGSDLWRIVMVNGGVKLSSSANQCSEVLQNLEKDGVSILVCGTCLEHFDLMSQKAVGDVTNMLDIITSFQLATKTIRV